MIRPFINSDPVPFDSISLDKKIILCSYIRSHASEDLSHFLAMLNDQAIRLAPNETFSCELINRLCIAGIIKPNCCNSENFHTYSEDNYNVKSETFHANVINSDHKQLSLKELSERLESDLKPHTDENINELGALWREYALHDTLEYFNYLLSERDFPYKVGEKTTSVLNTVLTKFSISQAYYFIYVAAKNASDFYQLKNISRSHAANTMPGKILSLFDRAISEKWEVAKYSKNTKECPPTALSNVLHDKILGSSGFEQVPNTSFIRIMDQPIIED